jgi:hypothetical protein
MDHGDTKMHVQPPAADSAPTPYSREEEVSDELWSNLMSVAVRSLVNSSHRKHVVHKLSSLLSGYSAAYSSSKDQDVTDTEWFFSGGSRIWLGLGPNSSSEKPKTTPSSI